MAQTTFTKESFWAELDALSEDEVRARVRTSIYVLEKRQLAELWLEKKAQERNDRSSSAQMRIARSAKNAAWAAATAAIAAAIIAAIGTAISILLFLNS
jgi:hypothetical protein